MKNRSRVTPFMRFFSATFLRLFGTLRIPQPQKRHIQPERYVQFFGQNFLEKEKNR
jgi:hypothetical protein